MKETVKGINSVSFRDKMQSYKKHPGSFLALLLVGIAVVLTVASFGYLIVYILVQGVPNLSPDLFAWEYTSDNVSMLPSMINTLFMTVLALLIAVPIGVGSAIYMVEYAKKGNRFVAVVRVTAETLTGIPSIVYGLFGCNSIRLAFIPAVRCSNRSHYGVTCYYAYHRGSTYVSTG